MRPFTCKGCRAEIYQAGCKLGIKVEHRCTGQSWGPLGEGPKPTTLVACQKLLSQYQGQPYRVENDRREWAKKLAHAKTIAEFKRLLQENKDYHKRP